MGHMIESEPDGVSAEHSHAAPSMTDAPRQRARRLRILALLFALVVIAVLAFASRYQPLTARPAWGSYGLPNSAERVEVSLAANLSNSGPFGISVLKLQPKVYADPPVVVRPLMPCFQVVEHQRECRQDSRGFVAGDRFYPFSLGAGTSMPVAWQYSFSCRPLSGSSYISGPVEVRVTYRLLFFTHSAMLVIPNTQTSGGSACAKTSG